MHQNNINTSALIQFINQVKAADASRQREIKLDINVAKNLSTTLALVMTRLAGNYEGLISDLQREPNNSGSFDGGSWDTK